MTKEIRLTREGGRNSPQPAEEQKKTNGGGKGEIKTDSDLCDFPEPIAETGPLEYFKKETA